MKDRPIKPVTMAALEEVGFKAADAIRVIGAINYFHRLGRSDRTGPYHHYYCKTDEFLRGIAQFIIDYFNSAGYPYAADIFRMYGSSGCVPVLTLVLLYAAILLHERPLDIDFGPTLERSLTDIYETFLVTMSPPDLSREVVFVAPRVAGKPYKEILTNQWSLGHDSMFFMVRPKDLDDLWNRKSEP